MEDVSGGWEPVRDSTARWWVVASVGVVGVYLVVGYLLAPMLLAPLGCSPTDQAVGYAPATSFDVSYAAESGDLEVTQTGGDTLPAERTDSLTVSLHAGDSRAVRNYTWTDVGGEYPIRTGDSVVVQRPTVDDRPLASGDVVRVTWSGTWEDPHPDYCPHESDTTGTTTLSKQEIGESPGE